MRTIFVPKETLSIENRVAIMPETVQKLCRLGAEVIVETGTGKTVGVSDLEYQNAGASIAKNPMDGYQKGEIIFKLRKPSDVELSQCKKGSLFLGFLDPFHDQSLLESLKNAQVSAIAMEFIPRSTIAQKMDALSSQANLAGYVSVILAAEHLPKVLPMMMTPSGTIKPARFFIVGVGVAGLQAIATAKRLGARVDAFDTRPVVEEQVKSLGAKFVKIDIGETGQTKDGYAKALTEDQIKIQREGMAKQCEVSDVVIASAQVFGRRAPVIITRPMIERMRPGSIIVDTAIESGGNVEGSEEGKIVEINGVKIIGFTNLAGRVPYDASLMYGNNLSNLIAHFWDREQKKFVLNREDEIIQNSLVTHDGMIVSERLKTMNAS